MASAATTVAVLSVPIDLLNAEQLGEVLLRLTFRNPESWRNFELPLWSNLHPPTRELDAGATKLWARSKLRRVLAELAVDPEDVDFQIASGADGCTYQLGGITVEVCWLRDGTSALVFQLKSAADVWRTVICRDHPMKQHRWRDLRDVVAF